MLKKVIASALTLAFMLTTDKCESHTVPGQKVYSPLINDIVFTASSLPSREFAEVIFNVPIHSANVGPLPVRGTWQRGWDGVDNGALHVITDSHIAFIECFAFRRVKLDGLKTGMQQVDHKSRDTQVEGPGSITCVAGDPKTQLPCRVTDIPNIQQDLWGRKYC